MLRGLLSQMTSNQKLIVLYLIEQASIEGIVENISYAELAEFLYVKPAPGRKNAGLPSKQTIRNHLKAIERDFPEHFKIISDGQKLKVQFLRFNELNRENDTEVNTDFNTDKNQASIGLEGRFSEQVNPEVNTVLNTEGQNSAYVKNLNIINKQNITNTNSKQVIAGDFYPSAETLAAAEARGFQNAANPDEIRRFIAYNQAQQTRFTDFNPLYLRWLERGQGFQQRTNGKAAVRTNNHVRSKTNSYDHAMARVIAANRHNLQRDDGFLAGFGLNTHIQALVHDDLNLWECVPH
ncbi:TPA: hypothetical protein U2K06_002822 [Legionella pneumophila]|nr:hypothetical protein [Legionella pneumophila]